MSHGQEIYVICLFIIMALHWGLLEHSNYRIPISAEFKPKWKVHTEETKTERDTCISLFIATLFTITRTWKQPRCPSTDKWIKEAVVYMHNGILLSHKKKCIWISSNEVDEPRTYYTEWSESERERKIPYSNIYIQNLEKWYWRIYLQGNSGETDIENRLMDMGRGEERVRCVERVTRKLTLPYVK